MPTPNEIPGVSLIDRLQAENKKLKEENSELQKSVGKLELFNKILEREIAELKAPNQEEIARQTEMPAEHKLPVPVKQVALYAVVVFLTIAAMYAIASFFGSRKAADPAQTATQATPPPVNVKTSVPGPAVPSAQEAGVVRKGNSKRPSFLPENRLLNDSFTANDPGLGYYKVRTRAYLHTRPDTSAKSELFINRLGRTVLEALDEKNGFVFIVFTNEHGKTSRGWLRKKDLFEVSMNDR